MEKNNLTPDNAQIDLSEYQKLDSEGVKALSDINPETEKKLEYLLLRIWFVLKIIAWIAFIAIFILSAYSWSRNQTQTSWIMKQKFISQGNAACFWVNSGNNREQLKTTEFLDFLVTNKREDLRKLLEDNTCLTPDTLSHLLGMEEKYDIAKLTEAYETTLIKKFQGSTLESSNEINTILSLDPSNRMQHNKVMKLIEQAVTKNSTKKSTVTCNTIKFQWLSIDISCRISSVPPVQPRDESLKFLESLEATEELIVSYPSSLDLQVDTKNNLLSTSFNVNIIYTPARYESDLLPKI